MYVVAVPDISVIWLLNAVKYSLMVWFNEL